jgi:hypothetical protein
MFIATLIWVIWHPSQVLLGEEAKFPSRKEERRISNQRKTQEHMVETSVQGEDGHGLLGSGVSTPERSVSPAPTSSNTFSYAQPINHGSGLRGKR